MNASQRRTARRQILATIKVDMSVVTPSGAIAKITEVLPLSRAVTVKYKNNRTAAFSIKQIRAQGR